MAEEDTTETQEVEQDPPEPEPEPKPDDRTARSEDDPVDWVAEAKKWEKRAKENSDAAARLKEIEDAQKSETEKLQERIAELEPTAKEAARLRVALRKGLTETLSKRLTGDTEEELEADADDLLETISSAETPVVPVTPRQGGEGSTPSRSPEELADAVMKRQRGF